MTHYRRRDFLKGILAAALTPQLLGVGKSLLQSQNFGPIEFPWSFYGKTDLSMLNRGGDHSVARLIEVERPPEGYSFFIRGMRLAVREDCRLADLTAFLDGWKASFSMGQSWVLPVRVPALLGGGMPGMVIAPQVMVKQDECLGLDIEGKSWQTTGPFVVEAEIYGVGITLESANAIPSKP